MGIRDQAWRQQIPLPLHHPHATAAAVYSCLQHQHTGDGRDTWQMAGLLVVPDDVIAMACALNENKRHFEATLAHCRQSLGRASLSVTDVLDRISRQPGGVTDRVRALLAHIGNARLHLRHCTRRIVILQDMPESISLSWMRSRRSIRKVTPAACLEKLRAIREKRGGSPDIDTQLALLNNLEEQDASLLREVQTVAHPSIKGKVRWANGDQTELGYLSMPALMAPGTRGGRLPPHTRPPETPPTSPRRARSDARLREEPLLPSIRVFLSRNSRVSSPESPQPSQKPD